jgi:hypothetical protein
MSSRFQAFGSTVMSGLQDAETGKLPRGALVVGLAFLCGTVIAIAAACLSLL